MYPLVLERWALANSFRILNTGSPFNVVAGQGSRNMEELVAHYEKVNAETTEKVANAVAKREA